ncbi:MAG: ankyrin repeat domain-containing protein [Vicinamibacterales bacterium]
MIHDAASRGDALTVRGLLAADPAAATQADPATGWDPLTALCFSPRLRERPRVPGFLDAARALLDAGASATTGFTKDGVFESVLYGAAGIARDGDLTALLLERGADPNDDEVVYHTPETHDHAALHALLASDRLTPASLAAMLLRKCDWHDEAGVARLLARGADPNRITRWGYNALHQAIRRDNAPGIVTRLLDAGADPEAVAHGRTATARAAWDGRGDVLRLLRDRGLALALTGPDRLMAACALDDGDAVRALAGDGAIVAAVLDRQGEVLAEFAGCGNTAGLAHLLALGADVEATAEAGDGYWMLAAGSTALHVAAWRARHDTVPYLIARGAAVEARDAEGRTPLMLAVRACVDSYWQAHRAPDSVAALLAAGASTAGVEVPTGYDAIDPMLARARGQTLGA